MPSSSTRLHRSSVEVPSAAAASASSSASASSPPALPPHHSAAPAAPPATARLRHATGTIHRDLPCARFPANHAKPPATRNAKKRSIVHSKPRRCERRVVQRKAGLHTTAELADMHAGCNNTLSPSIHSFAPSYLQNMTGNSWPTLCASFKLVPSPTGSKCIGSITGNSLQSFE